MRNHINDYDFDLPESLIAQNPADRRDGSRLLIVNRADGSITDAHFPDITTRITANDLLVVNNTRVLKARFLAKRETGGAVEVFLLRPSAEGGFHAMTRGKTPAGSTVYAGDCPIRIEERFEDGTARVSFPSHDPYEAMQKWGHVPLPPYIQRGDEAVDEERYQTVYAKVPGSVAAPTAGLHFTPEILENIRNNGAETCEVTLDVGAGTFQPMKAENLDDHQMHFERCGMDEQTASTLRTARSSGKRIVAVGTTSVRTLESFASAGDFQAGSMDTNLFIRPGYRFQAVDAMVTNFHLPKSTLFVLVCTFMGHELAHEAYAHAVREKYRFFSYGDAMLII